jgi:hypothetical protein
MAEPSTFADFERVEMRAGTVTRVEPATGARRF